MICDACSREPCSLLIHKLMQGGQHRGELFNVGELGKNSDTKCRLIELKYITASLLVTDFVKLQ